MDRARGGTYVAGRQESPIGRANTTQAKRAREQARDERAKAKVQVRVERKKEQATRPRREDGEDPDLIGIVPGPQPIPED